MSNVRSQQQVNRRGWNGQVVQTGRPRGSSGRAYERCRTNSILLVVGTLQLLNERFLWNYQCAVEHALNGTIFARFAALKLSWVPHASLDRFRYFRTPGSHSFNTHSFWHAARGNSELLRKLAGRSGRLRVAGFS